MRLEKAKAYFDSLQTHDDPDDEDLDREDTDNNAGGPNKYLRQVEEAENNFEQDDDN